MKIPFQDFNQSYVNNEFLLFLKQAEVTPVFKAEQKLDKTSYRPVCYSYRSVLPGIPKLYERLMYDQARGNEKNSGGGWKFIKKCWPTWLTD